MASRPYFNYSGEQLEQAVNANLGNPDTLKALHAELQFRSSRKMKALLAFAEERLLAQTKPSEAIGAAVEITIPPSTSFAHPPITAPAPKQADLYGEPPQPQGQATLTQVNLFGDADIESSQLQPPPTISSSARSAAPAPRPASAPASGDATTEPPRERRMGKMRKPGRLADVPPKRQFDLDTDFKLEVKRDATRAERYEACLKGLIAEMKRKKAASRQIVLEDGIRIQLDGKENGYQFPYNEDEALFEGAGVQIIIGGSHSDGRIVSFANKMVAISLKDDFGPRISACVVRIDNTAMLEALRIRMEKITKGEAGTFNIQLAESVLTNSGDELPPAFIAREHIHGLNACQQEAVARIVANEVYYLWGPPGTGKTQTLSGLCHSLIDSQKRILLCSNTNQAVDQVLLKLCRLFKDNNHTALDEGQVVRVGQITPDHQLNEWASYIIPDDIVERKSRSLIDRRAVLEEQLEKINARVAKSDGQMKAFKVLDGLIADKERCSASLQKAQTDYRSLIEAKAKIESKLLGLEEEKRTIQAAGTVKRVFLRSLESVDRDTKESGVSLLTAERQLVAGSESLSGLKTRLLGIDAQVEAERPKVAGVDRKRIEKELDEAEEQRRPVADEIADINKQLEDVKKSILDRALIVGATVTKAYLSPQQFSAFDVVIVDEASMVMLPALFNASGLAKEKVVISGDFRQLAPIVQSNQKVILETIGKDVFRACGIDKDSKRKRLTMLKEQYRMDDLICRLISSTMYKGDLLTASDRKGSDNRPPTPFDGPLTIVDTSSIWPFVNKDPFKSRYNLMNALAIRNLCRHFGVTGHLVSEEKGKQKKCVGVCTPYAAQAKVLQRVLDGVGLKEIVEAGTVHRYQGDEKNVMIIDIPDSHGEQRVGMFLEADHRDDPGAMLFNVAVSRARDSLIVFANLHYLDQKLPSHAILREILSDMQNRGKVVDVLDVLAMYPVMEDLGKLGRPFSLSVDAERFGLFDQGSFDQVCMVDIESARKSVAIYSGFVTEQRVAAYEALFRKKLAGDVTIRCITRPPKHNGSIPVEQGKAALDALEFMGCAVDTRYDIHEKVVIIDDEILWHGSLNALSHTNRTHEVMTRLEGKAICLQMSAFLALDRGLKPDAAEGTSVKSENPRCPHCNSRSSYRMGRYGAYWECEECDWKENFDRPVRRRTVGESTAPAPTCDKCGAPMKLRMSRYGDFYGCTAYPGCKNKMKFT